MIEDDDIETPKVPRGRRSDLTEKDLEEFVYSFSSVVSAGHLEWNLKKRMIWRIRCVWEKIEMFFPKSDTNSASIRNNTIVYNVVVQKYYRLHQQRK